MKKIIDPVITVYITNKNYEQYLEKAIKSVLKQSFKLKEFTEKSVLFMSVNKAKFRKPITPNDEVSFEVRFINRVRDVYKFYGICYKDNIKVSESEFSAMITYK